MPASSDIAALESAIVDLAARAAGSRSVDATTPFALLGVDSLGLVELAASVEDALGFEVPLELIADCADARSLALRLQEHRSAKPASGDEFDQMAEDGVLPDEIRPPTSMTRVREPFGLADGRCLLLTGATGFLGSWIAAHLLATSSSELICLVRRRTAGGTDRLRTRLKSCGADARAVATRVQVVEGDLTHPAFGLGHARVAEIARRVDAVCHAAAAVNWALPYRALRSSNAIATRELLRLACVRGIPFHFVSSLSVCYSTSAPAHVDETFDPWPHLRGVHLGYAQSKIVGEQLVREAGRRGLPVSIYRPSVISGHSTSGEFNSDDILARLVKGCVHMGAAPDLDWRVDALPVDVVARQIVRLSTRPGMFHLAHGTPRHWRECVLWMRLYGYPVSLTPYHAWLRELEGDTAPGAGDPQHPLRPLRPFFVEAPAGAQGLTLPELYEDARRAQASTAATVRELGGDGPPDLDAALLDRYFGAFVEHGHLAAPTRASRSSSRLEREHRLDAAFFTRALNGTGTEVRITAARLLERLSANSVISELTAWRSHRPTGVFAYELEGDGVGGPGSGCLQLGGASAPQRREVIVKIKAPDEDAIAVGEALAHVCDARVGDAFTRWRDRLGLIGAQARELAIYRQKDPRVRRHVPALRGALVEAGTCTLVLDRISDAVLLDSVDRPEAWTREHIDAAIDGLARLHAVWYGKEDALTQQPWIGHVATASNVAEMSDLWAALAAHAAPSFSSWTGPGIVSIHSRLARDIGTWWRAFDGLPRTLIHHDFNPRNVCLRRSSSGLELSAYDWELSTVGSPARDLAELLCFVLPDHATDERVHGWIDRHRLRLERETGSPIDAAAWRATFASALYDLLVRRWPVYALVHRVRRQAFLPRAVRAWRRLYESFPWRNQP